ncbi:MAG: flagellar biosynthesis anti-sigma factor FlgM [Gammaproteobacteria bacterium]|nr:flagellar biosynthesis anti-sigma factor FlgM [Gammaproteobacteria bacterium]
MNRIGHDSNRNAGMEGGNTSTRVSSLCGKRRARQQHMQASSEARISVQISDTEWQHIEELISQLPEIDATRVVRLHDRIMAAEYTVDSERLAQKLLTLETALNR